MLEEGKERHLKCNDARLCNGGVGELRACFISEQLFFTTVLDPSKRPVFFHCAQGMDRTGTFCALYRIEIDGWTNERAHAEMREFGWHDELYRAIGRFVLAYRPQGFHAGTPR